MWLVTNRGFYSGVAHRDDPNTIIIRARTDRHLEALMDLLPDGTQIVRTPDADYPCRVQVTAAQWIALAAKLASEVDYTNFKSSVERRPGVQKRHARYDHDVYLDVWRVLRHLTSARELGARARRSRRTERQHQDTLMSFDPWYEEDR